MSPPFEIFMSVWLRAPTRVRVDDDVGGREFAANAVFCSDDYAMRFLQDQRRRQIDVKLDMHVRPAGARTQVVHAAEIWIAFGQSANAGARFVRQFAIEQMIGCLARNLERAPAKPSGDEQSRYGIRPCPAKQCG